MSTMRTCPHCGTVTVAGPAECSHCGEPMRSPPLTAFSKRVRRGTVVAALVGFAGSFLGLVGTQAMAGYGDALTLLKYLVRSFVIPNGIGAALALLPTLLMHGVNGAKTYVLVVAAFCLAAAASAVLCTALSGILVIFIAVPLILIPAVAGWWTAGYAIRTFEPGTMREERSSADTAG